MESVRIQLSGNRIKAYGRIVSAHHASPYLHSPAKYPNDPAFHRMDLIWQKTRSVYGPAFTAVSAGATAVVGASSLGARLFFQGLAAVAVRNSNHFGAAGAYAVLAAEAGLVGVCVSAAWDPAIVPTHGAEPRFGTNPIAFAAPAGEAPPFCFDVATSTVAIGKLRLAELNGRPLATGWALDSTGSVTTDPKAALATRLLTPLGGTPQLSSHKGYGLAAVVEILSTMLSGASYSVTRDRTSNALDVGHFFMAIDPNAFRPDGGFETGVAGMMRVLRETRPAKEGEPVLAPGDPEARAFAERSMNGIPLPESLLKQVRRIAASAKAPWLLEGA